MREQEKRITQERGRYLTPASAGRARRGSRGIPFRRLVTVLVLLSWDGLLLYMIVRCLIEPVYGGLFVAVVSVYMGYQLHEEE